MFSFFCQNCIKPVALLFDKNYTILTDFDLFLKNTYKLVI